MATISTITHTHQNDECCAICMGDYSENKSKVSLGCNHSFHYSCLLQWNIAEPQSANHQSCPLCRHDLGVTEILSAAPVQPTTAHPRPSWTSINELNSLHLNHFLRTEQEHGIQLTCRDCNHKLEECDSCCRFICNCEYCNSDTNRYSNISARCPFDDDRADLDVEEGEVNIMYCAKCFEERDTIVLDYLNDDHGDIDYFNNFDMYQIYENYYKDKSSRDNTQVYDYGYPSYTFDEFIDYCQEMYARESIPPYELIDETIENFDHDELIDIIQENSSINIINNLGSIDEDVNQLNRNYVTLNLEQLESI